MIFTRFRVWSAGVNLDTHESQNFEGETLKKGTILKFKSLNFSDFDKQIVYIGVIDPAESKSGLNYSLWLLPHCHFGFFCQKLGKNSQKLVDQIGSQIRHCCVMKN